MAFAATERDLLLKVKGVVPKVVKRLEQLISEFGPVSAPERWSGLRRRRGTYWKNLLEG